ncbi:glycosyltransferase family 2 protein [Planctomyces sp. SH-PL62]|uniref:glycosyltransferase family 2 protein n=1 Tax=Planctomyces sp. SH-PL62 TaxID=1636152 RepID=UPI00078B1FF9|nr:glycosyltransferase family 2 protein [Planctomyces sp. SH-PL62]AMV39987.1 N-acetylglucosaminyl-diphospho-decaprenol L-rhamnosyltransferase [Planctomyces sp. SH-PL62]
MDPSPPEPRNRPEPCRLTVVVVNYDGWPDVEGLLDRLVREPEFRSGACRAAVVDNASPSPMPDVESFRRPGLRLVLRPDNGGFAVGVNAGWRASPAPWLLLLNPDVAVEPGAIGRILDRIDALEARPEGPPGVVGFGLRNADGSPQGSVGVFPSLARSFREQFAPRRSRKYLPEDRLRAGEVDWVTGACMLVNGRMMAEIGGLDEDFFLYHEEVAFCREARNRGWRIEYDPTVTVVHRAPLQDRPISPKMRVVIRHSKLLYFRKHTPRPQFLALAGIVELEAAARGAWAALRKAHAERRAWKTIGAIARQLRRGGGPLGRRVVELAESAERGPIQADDGGRRLGEGPSRPRPRRPSRASRAPDD